MYKLHIHKDAGSDLQLIKAKGDRKAFGAILAFLQQATVDQSILDNLSIDGFGEVGTEGFDVKKWLAQQHKGRNLWRAKVCNVERVGANYRILYAFNPHKKAYYVLAILPRGFNYDETDQRVQRLISAYDRLEIPAYR